MVDSRVDGEIENLIHIFLLRGNLYEIEFQSQHLEITFLGYDRQDTGRTSPLVPAELAALFSHFGNEQLRFFSRRKSQL
ncbi:hypothetical protein B5F76_02580 [Desulfovibrio sp. An276]|nr:hypothetical protein B5F76_02580 [Desulfovibrio sp. An276]